MTGERSLLALRALRLLRRGTLQPAAAPAVLRPFLADGLGAACDHFAAGLRRGGGDPRAVEAAIRFFGLHRLPEELQQIGAALAPRYSQDRSGISTRQTERLVSTAVTAMDSSGTTPAATPRGAAPLPPPWRDPFPPPHDPSARRWLIQAMAWAWAQVLPGDHTTAAALLHYEQEHELRARAPAPSSRTERQRWRRLAWSVLQVACYRAALAARAGSPARTGTAPAGRLLAVHTGHGEPEGLLALTAACADPLMLAEASAAHAALECVRAAVREGRHEAPQLFGLLRDAASRCQAAAGHTPPALEARLISLTAIIARERRNPAGIPAALAGLRRIDELLRQPSARRSHHTWLALVESGYRTSQELADLYCSLGRFTAARAAADIMRARLQRFGDPDPSHLPQGWYWNLLVTEASIDRHLARAGASPQRWLPAAATTAQRASDLAAAMRLPASWAVAAENEIIAVSLERLHDPGYRTSSQGIRQLADTAWHLRLASRHSQHIDDHQNRDTQRALLHTTLLTWELALLQADPAAIQIARAQVRTQLQSSATPLLPIDAQQITHHEQLTAKRLKPNRGHQGAAAATAVPTQHTSRIT
jgi:hypothetical protein